MSLLVAWAFVVRSFGCGQLCLFSLSAQVSVFWVGPVRCALGSEAGVVMPFAVWFIDGHMFVCKGFVSV